MSGADGRVQLRSAYEILIQNSRLLFQAGSNEKTTFKERKSKRIEGEPRTKEA